MAGFTIWLTGMSGAGKSTISEELVRVFAARSVRNVELLDGDAVREYLSKGLSFSKEDRDTNVRRIGFVAGLLAKNDVVVIAAAISPYREARGEVRGLHSGGNFLEVHVKVSLDKLVERDVKGLYKKALAGEIPHFTGVSDPYEDPLSPEVVVLTGGEETVAQSAAKVLWAAELLGYLAPSPIGLEALTPAQKQDVADSLAKARQV